MRRVISAALAMVMVMAISIPAFAIDKEREVSRLAYMNLDQASEAMQEKILQAREEIIFSKSWVADGLQGFVYDKDGNVIQSSLERRLMSTSLEQLKEMNNSIGVAGGNTKAEAILAALKGKYLDVLITDETTASNVLRLKNQE